MLVASIALVGALRLVETGEARRQETGEAQQDRDLRFVQVHAIHDLPDDGKIVADPIPAVEVAVVDEAVVAVEAVAPTRRVTTTRVLVVVLQIVARLVQAPSLPVQRVHRIIKRIPKHML